MNKEVIARIKLAPGRVGFFDPLSRIHLTLGSPEAYVYSGTNCASLRRNVKAGVIRIVSGTLGADVPPLRVVKVGKDYKLVSNAHEENKPVYAESEKKEAKASEEAEKKAIQDKAEAEARAIVEKEKAAKKATEEKVEEAAEEVAEKEATEEDAEAKEAEKETSNSKEESDASEYAPAEEEKAAPVKKTTRSRRRGTRKNTGK